VPEFQRGWRKPKFQRGWRKPKFQRGWRKPKFQRGWRKPKSKLRKSDFFQKLCPSDSLKQEKSAGIDNTMQGAYKPMALRAVSNR